MVSRARVEIKLSLDPSTLVRQVGGLHTEMLSMLGVFGDPAQQPVVALVPAWYLQGDHVMSAEENSPHLGAFPGQCQCGPNANQTKTGAEVRVVLQSLQKI